MLVDHLPSIPMKFPSMIGFPKLTFVAWRAKAPRVRRRRAVDGIVGGEDESVAGY